MANRLQHHPAANSSVPTTTVPQDKTTHAPLAPQSLTVRLAGHSIEPELLGAYPRWVQPKNPSRFVFPVVSLVSTQLPLLYNAISRHWSSHPLYFLIVIDIAFVVLVIVLNWYEKRLKQTLRRGRAYAAVLEHIGDKPSFVEGKVDFVYWHENSVGEIVRRASREHLDYFTEAKLRAGDTFTLLVSPENEDDVLPYFLSKTSRVVPVEATFHSQDVSERIAAQAVSVSRQTAGSLGAIEPELLAATPRRTRKTAIDIKARIYAVNILAAFATFFVLAPRFNVPLPKSNWIFFYFSMNGLLPLLIRQFKKNNLLINGTAARALITMERDVTYTESTLPSQHDITFSYQFEHGKEVKNGSFTLKRNKAWHLQVVEGSTFTVLYNPKNLAECVPYFQISDAELVGAMGAKITPPSP